MSDGALPLNFSSHSAKTDHALEAEFANITKLQQERNALAAGKKGSKTFDPANLRTDASTKASLTENFDTSLYDRSGSDKYAGYNTSIDVSGDGDVDMDAGQDDGGHNLIGQYTASKEVLNEFARGDTEEEDILMAREKEAQAKSRESEYQKKRYNRGALTPTRADPFAANRQANIEEGRTMRDVMEEQELAKEEKRVQELIDSKLKNGENGIVHYEANLMMADTSDKENNEAGPAVDVAAGRKRKKRWDVDSIDDGAANAAKAEEPKAKKSRWDNTSAPAEAAAPPKKLSRWDQAPAVAVATPAAGSGLETPIHPSQAPTFVQAQYAITDEELNALLPGEDEGYKILEAPPGYEPRRAVARPSATATLPEQTGGFMMQEPETIRSLGKQLSSEIPGVGELQFFKQEDMSYFGKLLDSTDETDLSMEDLRERKIMRLLLKVKNGTPPMRKTALRQLTDNARQFGAAPLFNQILPLLMEKTLEDQERHLLVKVCDRILFKLGDLCVPYVHRILVVIEPGLIDQSHFARVEAREIIATLARAVGLSVMLSVLRPDLSSPDEYVRNTTARAFAVVASALGIQTLVPFLKAVSQSRKSWEARHTAMKSIQQLAILSGSGVTPHLRELIDCVAPGLDDGHLKVRTVASLALAALAEAAYPYGIEAFDDVLYPLWQGARKQRGKALAGYLKAVGYIIVLMDADFAGYYATQIMPVIVREAGSQDEEMKRVVLKVISQCATTAGVSSDFLKLRVLPDFFGHFWARRIALDKRNYRAVVDTTVDIAKKVGAGELIERIVNNLKDESEPLRKMALETIEKIISALGAADIDRRLEELLVDGLLHTFSEQSMEDVVVLNGFGTIANALGIRLKPYLVQITSGFLYKLNNRSPTVRQQAADLVARIAHTMKQCEEDGLLAKLSSVLYEYLGEEYPEVLGSIIGALRSIVTVVGIREMQPPLKDLLPRITPILRNRHEKVQENAVDMVGRIADKAGDAVSAREWMRIVFELLDLLKAHKKSIRRAANNTFGFIGKAIGPSDVLATLLSNLRVQERQSRVCSAVAIAILAEQCAPFTVIPSLLVEYQSVQDLNTRVGVLKACSFLFEYIGDMAKDYVYSVVPMLEDALVDRDQVHRQTAANVVQHIALGVTGLGCEDAMEHLLNLLMPNVYEVSPHVINRVLDACNAIRVAIGMGKFMGYFWQGLFHPARKVRRPYWRVYNEAYVHQADSMVPYYPIIPEQGMGRPELEIVI
ncbi:MAG: hypothetical protein M1820_002941 [Bogoriella megaspora]|nr:MAG: hypothetical protein M1820_002941 [Bogoriella megaspora]